MASDEQFSLCWNNFHANMSAGFHGLLSRGDLVDVTLAAEGRLLQAHKLVLSVCSPYFQEMFKMNPTQHPIVFLKDVSHSALRDLLQFMYQGEVNVKQEELASFISTAEQLQVKGLTGNQNEESSTPSKPKPTSRPGPRSSQQRQSVMTKLETDLDSKPSSTPVAIKRTNRPSIASNNSSSSQSGPAKRKCVDPLEAGPSGSAKEEFVTIPDEDENNAVAPKMEPEFVNESMWDEDDDGTNNDETNFGEDDSNMEMSGFDGSTTGDGNLTGGGEGGAVGDAQDTGQNDVIEVEYLQENTNNQAKTFNKNLEINEIFHSYDDLKNRVKEFQANTNSVFYIRDSISIEKSRRQGSKKYMNDVLRYKMVKYWCINGGKGKDGCQAFFKVKITADGKCLYISSFDLSHNHILEKIQRKPIISYDDVFIRVT
ncbi:protein tramtrack, beta isoform isoform X6 [Bicyclus anynana]|uniref:Protein tramtrack, beta isoform isoform X6 n=1 Tax=Bicyclus anynana TaxID=110368 RepID=A0A6J1NG31_BICAN|nr:protein tramtrack, beta isoform isoform X6 [Bicyclus anynana]